VGLLVLAVSITGCASVLDPLPSQPCTPFGCNKPGNIIQELGGMILFMGLIAAALAGIVQRISK